MAVAKDLFHNVVKHALQKEGWSLIDLLRLKIGPVEMAIDLGADRLVGAEREGERIAVEVKSFLVGASAISEFHTALGQYINYRGALRIRDPDRSSLFGRARSYLRFVFSAGVPTDDANGKSGSAIGRQYSIGDDRAMDKLDTYRQIIQDLLTEHCQHKRRC
jgi:XisH protein